MRKKSRSYGYADESKKSVNSTKKLKRTPYLAEKKPLFLPLRVVWFFLLGLGAVLKYFLTMINKSTISFKSIMMKWGLIAIIFFVVAGTGYTLWISKDLPDPNRLTDRQIDQSTKIYDRTGEHLLYEIFSEKRRTLVDLEDIPQHVIDGVISTEDTTFYEHHGIRPLSILRAAVMGLLPGRRVAGTSTLTQQLVKNAILTNERSLNRKIKEAILSIRLEQKYSKDQILKIYFNEIPYGSTNYGIESASQNYFGKSVKDVTLDEAAILAGFPKAPSKYLRDVEALKIRRDFVLKRMFEEGFITEKEKDDAQAKPIAIQEKLNNITAPHFVLQVRDHLVEQFGENLVNTGGLKVITTLDFEKQEAAEKAVKEVGSKILSDAGANNTALVALDPKNGHILAMVGSYDFYDDDISGKFNVATLGKRQPGSSFKPIIYAAAFELGYTPSTVLYDVVTNFAVNGKSYVPKNYDLQEHGPVTIRQALQGSLNIPAVKALYLVGAKKGVEFAQRLGYTTLGDGDFGLSLVLGGGEVTLLEHVSAFGVFANQGVLNKPVTILQVEDNKNEVLFTWKNKKGEKVISEDVANTISNVLIDDGARAYAFGAGGILTLKGRQVAAKTGTTNGYVDGWTVGYTPSLVAGVWAGNTDNKPMKQGFGGSRVAAPIWNAFMLESLKPTAAEAFPPMPEIKTDKAVLNGQTGGSILVKINKLTGRKASSSTPEHLIVERQFIQPHSILHYVNKEDPQGSEPNDPTTDPQYQIWEEAIQSWIKRKQEKDPEWQVSFGEPPTETDDEYSLELIPSLEIVYPAQGTVFLTRQIDTDIRVSAPRGISQVVYKIDGVAVDTVRTHPFNLNITANNLVSGPHVLEVTAEDDIGNRAINEVTFVIDAGEVKPSLMFTEKTYSVNNSDFPITMIFNQFELEKIKSAKIIATLIGTQNTIALAEITNLKNLFDNQLIYKLVNSPGTGNWDVSVQITDKKGEQFISGQAVIEVK